MNRLRGTLFFTVACLIALGLVRAPIGAPEGEPLYDVVIRNGRVLDGAGNPWIAADVAIKNGRFVRLGRVTGQGRTEIDASGKYVSPGWIDMMDQSGYVLPRNGLAENKVLMGVTTAIGGEGIDYVLVNGQVVVERGRHTGARPGQVLYGPGRQAP